MEYVIKNLFGILVTLNLSEINHAMLKNIQILINQLKNVSEITQEDELNLNIYL